MKTIAQKLFLACIIISFAGINKIKAQSDIDNRLTELTITGGAWLSGPSEIWVGRMDQYATKNMSLLVRAMGDVYLNKHFAIGLYINLCPGYGHDGLSSDNKSKMFEYGAGFKPVFYFSDKTCMKTGINVGLRKYKSDYVSTTGRGLGVNCSIEIQHKLNGRGLLTIEPGFLAQPTGYANEDRNKYTYAPIFYLNIGYSIFSNRAIE